MREQNSTLFYQVIQDTLSLYYSVSTKLLKNIEFTKVYNYCKNINFADLDYSSEANFISSIDEILKNYQDTLLIKNTIEFNICTKKLYEIETFLSVTNDSQQSFYLKLYLLIPYHHKV